MDYVLLVTKRNWLKTINQTGNVLKVFTGKCDKLFRLFLLLITCSKDDGNICLDELSLVFSINSFKYKNCLFIGRYLFILKLLLLLHYCINHWIVTVCFWLVHNCLSKSLLFRKIRDSLIWKVMYVIWVPTNDVYIYIIFVFYIISLLFLRSNNVGANIGRSSKQNNNRDISMMRWYIAMRWWKYGYYYCYYYTLSHATNFKNKRLKHYSILFIKPCDKTMLVRRYLYKWNLFSLRHSVERNILYIKDNTGHVTVNYTHLIFFNDACRREINKSYFHPQKCCKRLNEIIYTWKLQTVASLHFFFFFTLSLRKGYHKQTIRLYIDMIFCWTS